MQQLTEFTTRSGWISIGTFEDRRQARWPLWDNSGSRHGTIIDIHHGRGGGNAGLDLLCHLAHSAATEFRVRVVDPAGVITTMGPKSRIATTTSEIADLLTDTYREMSFHRAAADSSPHRGRQVLVVDRPDALADGPRRQLERVLRTASQWGVSVVVHATSPHPESFGSEAIRTLVTAPPATLVTIRATEAGQRTAYLREDDEGPFTLPTPY